MQQRSTNEYNLNNQLNSQLIEKFTFLTSNLGFVGLFGFLSTSIDVVIFYSSNLNEVKSRTVI